uniref:CASP2 and RIPK1 domain containing adaptor with death domain n=1 Tax=Cynoglossus semilaevis TaxID=244447 RepID=A0A3P8UTT7_CYNSE
MDPAHRALLQKHRVALATELLVSDHIVPYLYQEQILTDSQVEDIESQSTNKRKVFRLLDLLPNRGPLAFSCFLRSLDDFSWVRELRNKAQTERVNVMQQKKPRHCLDAQQTGGRRWRRSRRRPTISMLSPAPRLLLGAALLCWVQVRSSGRVRVLFLVLKCGGERC